MKKKAKVRGKSASRAAAKRHTNGGKTAHPAMSQSLSLLSEIIQESLLFSIATNSSAVSPTE